MSDTKFTPGPWYVVDNESYLDISTANADYKPCIANTCPSKHLPGGDNEKPNACLIAAAPDLYSALAELDEAYCRADGDLTREERQEDRQRLINARAALAKARGE